VVHTLSLAMGPFVPDAAARLAHILDVPMENHGWQGGHDCWNDAHKPMKPGKPIEQPEVLFPKLEKDDIEELADAHRRGEAF
jgi:methionyl-tRNA synthetase